jgi:threonine synthase
MSAVMSAPRYRSTRAGEAPVPLAEALRRGLAPDGGLYVPDHVPALPDGWRDAPSFPDLAAAVLRPWLDGAVLDAEAAVRDALNFPVPLVPLAGPWAGVFVLELFHGPTLSFKDFGARTLARLMTRVTPPEAPTTVLVATSGDTGSAVADGFAGLPGVRVVLLFPEGRVSPVQERQLVAERPGVTAVRVAGTFDDCQRLVKEAFADARFSGLGLTSANSINAGRLLPQMTYYVEAVRAGGFDAAVFVVPSGNLGNLTAGVLAALAGLPVRRFVAAHNANDAFVDHLNGAPMQPRATIQTPSNAMDVGAPSNFERLAALLDEPARRQRIADTSVDADATRAALRAVYDEAGYVACPHTAVGLEAARRYRIAHGTDAPVVVLATAHPAKFPETVEAVLGVRLPEPDALAHLRPGPVHGIPPTRDALAAVMTA